jgi:broad specificity phosphatase PhoE
VTRLLLIRHAHAGDRARWRGPDDQRPLSEKGWRQARGLVPLLSADAVGRIASSPSLRCVQTVLPLAEARGLHVEEDPRLLEGTDPHEAFTSLEAELATISVAASTHGDLVPAILDLAADRGARLPADVRWPKGCTWVLEHEDGRWLGAHFLPPPQS